MDNVRSLLTETRLPLQEIAYRTGFISQAYLAIRFKKHFGRSMREYGKIAARLVVHARPALSRIKDRRPGMTLSIGKRAFAKPSGLGEVNLRIS